MIHSLMSKKSIEKEVKNMKKLIVILTVAAMLASMPAPAFAAFTQDGVKVLTTATVTVGGTGGPVQGFSATLKNITGNGAATEVAWDPVTAGSTQWLKAKQYVEILGYQTFNVWGIQAWCDNKKTGASYQFTGSGDPAGLVKSDGKKRLPMCWRTLESKVTYTAKELDIKEIKLTTDGTWVLSDGYTENQKSDGTGYYPWFYLIDKNTVNDFDDDGDTEKFSTYNYIEYTTFVGQNGWQHAPETYSDPLWPNPYYMYLGAKFNFAYPNEQYKMNTFTIEMYHE
ncbi:MAG: hypothetical protein V2A72_07635 [Candidatus Omnitrophota bacterium]